MFLDVLGIGLFIPAIADLKIFYATTDFGIAMSLTIYSLCAFFAAPVLWQISDKYGRKHVLLGCILWTLGQFLVLLVTQSFWIFLIARIINGLTGGNFSILQSILTDLAKDEDERKANFGVLWAVFGIGFIIWPLLGTFLLQRYGVEWIFVFCALFALIEAVLIVVYLKETKARDDELHLSFKPFRPFITQFQNPKIGIILRILVCVVVSSFIYQSVMSVYMNKTFGVPWYQIWYYLSMVWVISAINQGFLLKAFRFKKFTHKQLIIGGNLIRLFLVVCMAFITDPAYMRVFVLCRVAISLFMWPLMPVYNNEVIKHADKRKLGEINGLLGSLQSVGMIFGPVIGGALMQYNISVFRWSALGILIMLLLNRRFLNQMHVD